MAADIRSHVWTPRTTVNINGIMGAFSNENEHKQALGAASSREFPKRQD
jgi:hypothetical protein